MINVTLSEGEWKLMNALWETAPCSLSSLVKALDEETGWTKPTIFVMLRRLITKGAVTLDQSERIQLYSPIVAKEDCVIRETVSFLSKVYNGNIGLMISSLAGQNAISQDEITELKQILNEAEKNLSNNGEK